MCDGDRVTGDNSHKLASANIKNYSTLRLSENERVDIRIR